MGLGRPLELHLGHLIGKSVCDVIPEPSPSDIGYW